MYSLIFLALAAAATPGQEAAKQDVAAAAAAEPTGEAEASAHKTVGEAYIASHLKKLKIRKIRVDKKKTFPEIEIEWPYTFVETAKAGGGPEYSTCLTVTYKGPSGRSSTPIGYRISIAGSEVVRFTRIPEYVTHPDLVPVPLFKKDVCQDLMTRFGMALVPKPHLVPEAADDKDRKSSPKTEPDAPGGSPAADASAKPGAEAGASKAAAATPEPAAHATEVHASAAGAEKLDLATDHPAPPAAAVPANSQQPAKRAAANSSDALEKPVNAPKRNARTANAAKAKPYPAQSPKTQLPRSDSIALSKLIGPGDISHEDVCSIGRLMLEQYFGSRSALLKHVPSYDPKAKAHSSGSRP